MNFQDFFKETDDFRKRIVQAFKLQPDEHHLIEHRNIVISWLKKKETQLQEMKNVKSQSFIKDWLNKNQMQEKKKKIEKLIEMFLKFKKMLQCEDFSQIANPTEYLNNQLFDNIRQHIEPLLKNKIPVYYGYLKAPLIGNMIIKKKQDFKNCVQSSPHHNLKFIVTQNTVAHKYQRNLLQQVFGRIVRHKGGLSLMVKIQVHTAINQKQIQLFCYIEDLNFKFDDCKQLKDVIQIQKSDKQYALVVKVNDKQIEINHQSILQNFLSQMFVIPIQTLVSEYVIQIKEQQQQQEAFLVKHYKGQRKQLGQSALLKDHPAIRNPSFYFRDYIMKHEILNKDIIRWKNQKLYPNFYSCLRFTAQLMISDFSFYLEENRINSLCFDEKTFICMWGLAHQLSVISDWVQQVINPIKKSVTIYEIMNKFSPILSQMVQYQGKDFEQYKNHLLNLQADTFMTSYVPKYIIERYKDIYISLNNYDDKNTYNDLQDVYKKIFGPIMNQFDIESCDTIEAVYFLNFIGEMKKFNHDKQDYHESWKNQQIWAQVYEIKQKQQLPYVNIYLDIIGFYLGINTYEISKNPFNTIKNQYQTELFLKDLNNFVVWLQINHQRKCNNYLSILFQKAYRHKKYKTCDLLLNYNVFLSDFEEIFQFEMILTSQEEQMKQYLAKKMRQKSPQMYRRFKWQELMRKTLKQQKQDNIMVKTIKYGQIYVRKQLFKAMQLGQIQNNISRKDYMFDPQRSMRQVPFSQDTKAYIQYTSFPLVRYFYKLFLQQLNKGHLMPNFTGLINDEGIMLHLLQSIPKGLNFQKGCNTYTESDLKNLLQNDQLSQSILLSIILMPSKIMLKNIIVIPDGNQQSNNAIFLIDFKQFYRKNPIQKKQGNYELMTKNCLFTFDEMHKIISNNLIKKFSDVQIIPFVQNLFQQLAQLQKKVNTMKQQVNDRVVSRQFLGLIFQKNFIISLTERMFKIRHCFLDCLEKNKSISHMQLLAIINPELSYYYTQIIKSSSSLIERQKRLHDDLWRKPFLNKRSLIDFFACSAIIPEPINAFPNQYKKLCFEGPTENLNSLYNQSKKFRVFDNDVQSLNVVHHETLQYYVRHLDFSKLSKQDRKLAVTKLQQKSQQYLNKKGYLPLNIIKLQDVDILKASELKFSYERLKQVVLQNINTNDIQLSTMLKQLMSAICIKMKNLSGIKSLGQYSYLQFSLQMKNLRILNITECNQLKTIDIKCDAIQNVTVRDNKQLETIYIKSRSLENIDCTGSNKIKLENIGVYILKGINVLISDTACDGYMKKLKNQSYSTFVLNILKFMFNRLKQSEIKAIIVVTLTRLKVLDQQMAATMIGVSSMNKVSGISNLVLKYSVDLQKKVYCKLIDLFLNNGVIETLPVFDMNFQSLEKFCIYLKEKDFLQSHSFKKIELSGVIKQNYKVLKQMYSVIKLNKHLKLHVQGFEMQLCEGAMDVIDYLINKRQNLQKIDLQMQTCKISTDFLEKMAQSSIIFSLFIINSTINNGMSSEKKIQSLKELTIKDSSINNFKIMRRLTNLVALDISNCQMPENVESFYDFLGQKSFLRILKFKSQKPINKQLHFDKLLSNLKNSKNLQHLDLSHNSFNAKQLLLLNQFLEMASINDLVLNDGFYQKGLEQFQFSKFLNKAKLKSLEIQFLISDTENLKQFILSLSQQSSILKVHLKTENQVPSVVFSPLNKNKTINSFTSNQLIPTWLKKHIKDNTVQKSKIYLPSFSGEVQVGMMHNSTRFNDYYKLGLSLDGGGVRGLLLATQLEYLADQVGYPLHKIFDVIGGTSIGGILSLALTATLDNVHPVMTPKQLTQVFTIHGNQIFKKSQIRQFTNLYDTKYSPQYIQNLLNSYFKDCRLSDTLKQTNTIVTAVSRTNNKDVIFKSTDAILNRDKDFYVKDIARATSAAPTYFPSAQIKNIIASEKLSLIDGGMGMNNPSKLVIDEIKKMAFNSNSENYFLLSLGTGRLPCENIPQFAGIKDIIPIMDSFTQSAGYFTERDLAENYKGRYMRVSPLINLTKKQGQLDSTQPQVLKTYQQTGLSSAKDSFSNTIIFGKYRTMNLIQWLRQNTEKKYDL